MARPGLEPGTRRFSVVRSGLAGGAQSLETKRFSSDQSSKQKSAIYELLHAVQEMEASHLLFFADVLSDDDEELESQRLAGTRMHPSARRSSRRVAPDLTRTTSAEASLSSTAAH
jgi:hypothetical protein